MQAAMVLEKELRVLHPDLQTAGKRKRKRGRKRRSEIEEARKEVGCPLCFWSPGEGTV